MPEGTRLYLLAPIVRGRKGEYRKELGRAAKRGFQRVKVDGRCTEIEEVPALDKKVKHDIEVVVDRVVRQASMEPGSPIDRNALGTGGRSADRRGRETGERTTFSAKFACPVSRFHDR